MGNFHPPLTVRSDVGRGGVGNPEESPAEPPRHRRPARRPPVAVPRPAQRVATAADGRPSAADHTITRADDTHRPPGGGEVTTTPQRCRGRRCRAAGRVGTAPRYYARARPVGRWCGGVSATRGRRRSTRVRSPRRLPSRPLPEPVLERGRLLPKKIAGQAPGSSSRARRRKAHTRWSRQPPGHSLRSTHGRFPGRPLRG